MTYESLSTDQRADKLVHGIGKALTIAAEMLVEYLQIEGKTVRTLHEELLAAGYDISLKRLQNRQSELRKDGLLPQADDRYRRDGNGGHSRRRESPAADQMIDVTPNPSKAEQLLEAAKVRDRSSSIEQQVRLEQEIADLQAKNAELKLELEARIGMAAATKAAARSSASLDAVKEIFPTDKPVTSAEDAAEQFKRGQELCIEGRLALMPDINPDDITQLDIELMMAFAELNVEAATLDRHLEPLLKTMLEMPEDHPSFKSLQAYLNFQVQRLEALWDSLDGFKSLLPGSDAKQSADDAEPASHTNRWVKQGRTDHQWELRSAAEEGKQLEITWTDDVTVVVVPKLKADHEEKQKVDAAVRKLVDDSKKWRSKA